MIKTILNFHTEASAAIEAGTETADIFKLPIREEIGRAKYIPEEEVEKIAGIRETISQQIKEIKTAAVS
jgi:V/A-type H+-transporting ATPase subunit A